MVRGAEGVDDLRALYLAKAEAEQEAADALVPGSRILASGDPLARVLLVKGEPGPGDIAAGEALAGPDGDAARAALSALGIDPAEGILAVVTRPAAGTPPEAAVERLARYVEAADPALVVALDATAAADLASAVGLRELPFGIPAEVQGRRLLAVDGLEVSLTDDARKKRVWSQFRTLAG